MELEPQPSTSPAIDLLSDHCRSNRRDNIRGDHKTLIVINIPRTCIKSCRSYPSKCMSLSLTFSLCFGLIPFICRSKQLRACPIVHTYLLHIFTYYLTWLIHGMRLMSNDLIRGMTRKLFLPCFTLVRLLSACSSPILNNSRPFSNLAHTRRL